MQNNKHYILNFLSGIIIGFFIVVSILYMTDKNIILSISNKYLNKVSPTYSIENVGSKSFNYFKNEGINESKANTEKPIDSSEKLSSSLDKKMDFIEPIDPVNFVYIYTGDINIPSNIDVYKKKSDKKSIPLMESNLLSMGLVDLNRFGVLNLQSLSTSEENKDKGYQIYVDLTNQNISISENYIKWQKFLPNCKGDSTCWDENKITEDDIPSDNMILSLANNFLADYKIDISMYGEPTIDKYWEDQKNTQDEIYYPDVVNVTYPLIIENKEVYEEYGSQNGLNVGINIRLGQVSSVYGIEKINLESSQYDTISQDEIKQYIAKGGVYEPYKQENAKNIDLYLKEPQEILVKTYTYDDSGNHQYYVPALKFEVLDNEEAKKYYYNKYVIIPLVSDVIQYMQNPMARQYDH